LFRSHNQKQALSRFTIAAMMFSDPVLAAVRRELRRMSPDVRIDVDQIRSVLSQDVLKRDVLAGEKPDESRRKVQRLLAKAPRVKEGELSKSTEEGPQDAKLHCALQPPAAEPIVTPGTLPTVADARPS
jgi:hypothetical protein